MLAVMSAFFRQRKCGLAFVEHTPENANWEFTKTAKSCAFCFVIMVSLEIAAT